MGFEKLTTKPVPVPPSSVFKLLGPSFILIGLGLGTGELILWPYLVSNWGLGIIWGALLGISMQYFLNMEIERYSLVNGESIFVGFARLLKWLPFWFIFSTVIAWSWPGFSAGAAEVLRPLGIYEPKFIAIAMLFLAGAILTLGPVLYTTVEYFQKFLIMIGVPVIILISIFLVKWMHVELLLKGLVGIGDGYMFAPETLPLLSFLAAFAYSGAGGNLLLAQSFYVKEKGYAMGKYAGRITSLITGKKEDVRLEGYTIDVSNAKDVERYRRWWKLANLEHLIVFWGLGLFTMLLLAVLAYATVNGNPAAKEGLEFIFIQAEVIGSEIGQIFGVLLILVTSLMLFSTQLSVIDSAGRIVSENIAIMYKNKIGSKNLAKVYYMAIWVMLLFGIGVFLVDFKEPRFLIVLGAVLNAVCMFVFSGILIPLNKRFLPKILQPAVWRQVTVWIIFVFLGVFSSIVFLKQIFNVDVFELI